MRAVYVAVLALWTAVAVGAQHEAAPPSGPVLVPQSLTGSTSFDLYCASCHGRGGTGDGPVGSALVTRPADLTQLSRRHGGMFPRDEVRAFIEGSNRRAPAHGSSDMPVWGPTFHALETSDARVRVRLDNLVAFIESMQRVPDPTQVRFSAPDGGALFRSHCASCHGVNGRGDGPMSAELLQRPSDLTKFAMRNGGVFPSAQVARIIDGRDISAHGSAEMPVWGDVFKRTPEASEQTIKDRIASLVQFLESIQERTAQLRPHVPGREGQARPGKAEARR